MEILSFYCTPKNSFVDFRKLQNALDCAWRKFFVEWYDCCDCSIVGFSSQFHMTTTLRDKIKAEFSAKDFDKRFA